jgi:preprotein translocase subunit YajC
MLSALKKGDKIVTIGGIHGVIQSVKEGTVVVKVDDSTKIEFSRSAIASVVESAKAEKATAEAVTDETK